MRKRGYMQRKVDVRPLRETFLIVCEGAKTEPAYFKAFRVAATVEEFNVVGLGDNTLSLVERAVKLKSERDYDQVWCVFDRDSFPPERFNAALALAEREDMKVAYSNEAFELWYLLHFNYHDTAMSRTQYEDKLSALLGIKYKKNAPDMYERLRDRQHAAIKYATKLLATYDPCRPAQDNPSTTVHKLVEALNKSAV